MFIEKISVAPRPIAHTISSARTPYRPLAHRRAHTVPSAVGWSRLSCPGSWFLAGCFLRCPGSRAVAGACAHLISRDGDMPDMVCEETEDNFFVLYQEMAEGSCGQEISSIDFLSQMIYKQWTLADKRGKKEKTLNFAFVTAREETGNVELSICICFSRNSVTR